MKNTYSHTWKIAVTSRKFKHGGFLVKIIHPKMVDSLDHDSVGAV